MKRLFFLIVLPLSCTVTRAQENTSIILTNSTDAPPPKHRVMHPQTPEKPVNEHLAQKETAGGMTYSDWYDLWDEMYDPANSYSYHYDIYPDSNLLDTTGFYPPFSIFTHGMGMSFDPSDSAYYYHPFNPAYRVSAPFPYTLAYKLDSFRVPGQYMRYDLTPGNVDSLIIEFLVTQNGGAPPDSGCYALISTTADTTYRHCTADETPRFATPRYFRTTDDCIDPALTTITHQRYAVPLTIADAFIQRVVKIALTTPITVVPGKYVAAYVYFKSAVAYPLVTSVNYANYYWLYAGEPYGASTWFPQSAHNLTTGYPGSHQDGLIATNQIRYSDAGFTFNGHNVLLPSYAYAAVGADPPPGFDVPEMAFHIRWTMPDTSLSVATGGGRAATNVFPNPCNDRLHIWFDAGGQSGTQILLFDLLGKPVARQDMGKITQGTAVFSTTELPAGIYLYAVCNEAGRTTGRIEVRH